MDAQHSISFFERQFQEQVISGAASLNPFELDALPHLRGEVLDFGCGLGNLAVAAALKVSDCPSLTVLFWPALTPWGATLATWMTRVNVPMPPSLPVSLLLSMGLQGEGTAF